MAYFKTSYDASNLTISIDDAEVTRALGVLRDKTPAALKVAVNTTARQTRKLLLTEVKNRYDLNTAGKRMIEDLRQRQKATNRRPAAILAIMKNDPGAFRADLGYFRTSPTKPFMGPSVRNAPPVFQAHVLKSSPMIGLGGTSEKSKGFLCSSSQNTSAWCSANWACLLTKTTRKTGRSAGSRMKGWSLCPARPVPQCTIPCGKCRNRP